VAAVDTNVLLRLLVDDDETQARDAAAFVRTSGRVFVSHVVLVEASWVLASAYGLGRQELARTIELVLSTDAFHVERAEILGYALANFRQSTADFADCVIAATARAAGELPLGTFDAAAGRLPGARRLGRKRKRE
jgi:predicted nucleic-acid-binding protein